VARLAELLHTVDLPETGSEGRYIIEKLRYGDDWWD
jgi:hypothetical protein